MRSIDFATTLSGVEAPAVTPRVSEAPSPLSHPVITVLVLAPRARWVSAPVAGSITTAAALPPAFFADAAMMSATRYCSAASIN